ncbi:hypothetical protein BKX95_02725 [Streptococcus iniae]|nr:hypothetical protein BKX95_02725 [Streptococcus iniae]
MPFVLKNKKKSAYEGISEIGDKLSLSPIFFILTLGLINHKREILRFELKVFPSYKQTLAYI